MNNSNEEPKSLRLTLFKTSKKTVPQMEQKNEAPNLKIEKDFQNLTVSSNLAVQVIRRHSKSRRPSDTPHNLITINKDGVPITRELSHSHEVIIFFYNFYRLGK